MSAETGGRNPVRRPNFRVSSAHFTYFWRLTRGYVGGASPGVKTYQNQGLGGGARQDRTDDLFNAIEALYSQLSYGPEHFRNPLRKPVGADFLDDGAAV